MNIQLDMSADVRMKMGREVMCLGEQHGEGWSNYNADAVDFSGQMPSGSVDYCIHSPPFANLYTYSDSALDMGNCADDAEFFRHYAYLLANLYRVMRPGRNVSVHCKDLVDYKGSSGRAGLRDFPGDIIRAYEAAGFKYHSRVTIFKCPVTEMQRTKSHGLLYKQLRADSTHSRQGLAEYVLTFRKWAAEGDEIHPVTHPNPVDLAKREEEARALTFIGEPVPADLNAPARGDLITLDQWQKWASPVWLDIVQTDVLNVYHAREDRDEKHMCPLQLDLIDRCVALWSNPGDVVYTPFSGIGSELYGAIKRRRYAIGTELKYSYFLNGSKNARSAEPLGVGTQVGFDFDFAVPA